MSPIPPDAAPRQRLAIVLMLASGFAGLGYQIIWMQQFALCLGNEAASVLAVVAAFFAGLATGALVLGCRVERSSRPQQWYAFAEVLTAAWSLLLAVAVTPVGSAVLRVIGTNPSPPWQWGISFSSTFLLLLPATTAMGVTLPAMERALAARDRRSIAGLYAANTLGAVIGVIAIALWLIPHFGLQRATLFCAVFNLLAAFIALRVGDTTRVAPGLVAARGSGARAALGRLAATGFLGIGFEILVVRVLSQVAEDTVYTFALLLALYLAGTALGAAAYRPVEARSQDPVQLRRQLLVLLGLACLLSTGLLYGSEDIKAHVQAWLGEGFHAALGVEATLALLIFATPTVFMGALFSHLCRDAQRAGATFGQAIGINTLGAAVAPVAFGVLIVPALGPKFALVAVCVGYVLLGAGLARRSPLPWLAAAGCAAVAALAPALAFVELPEGARLVTYRDGVTASVSVVEDASGVSRLRINNRQQEGANANRRVDGRQALLPLLLHPAPRRALFLGIGAGNTAATAAEEPGVEVDAVELLPEVIEAAERFTGAFPPAVRARLHFMASDARRYVKTADRQYEVIVADNFHPARSGTGSLYTVEHFTAVRARLSSGGLFCQWLPLHQLDIGTLQSIVRSFLEAYPHAYAILASNSLTTPTVGLVGFAGEPRLDRSQVAARVQGYGTAARRAEFGVEDEFAVLGGFIAGPAALARFAAGAPLNTDDHPVVAYGAPRITYAPDSTPVERLETLLGAVSIAPAEIIDARADDDGARRLGAYWTARNQFIDSGRSVRPSAEASTMLDQVQLPLLTVLKLSPDFRPAYEPLVRLAEAVASSDGERGRRLLEQLAALRPARPDLPP